VNAFEFSVNEDVSEAMALIKSNYPKEIKSFMEKEGNRLKAAALKNARNYVGTVTGNYLKGIKRGKYYKYDATGADSIRLYAGQPARHAHLVEYGHEMVTHSGERTGQFVRGHLVFANTADAFASRYEDDCEAFADKIFSALD